MYNFITKYKYIIVNWVQSVVKIPIVCSVILKNLVGKEKSTIDRCVHPLNDV